MSKAERVIKFWESLHDGDLTQVGLQPKLCPANVWTVGWGRVLYYKGELLKGIENKDIAYSLFPNLTKEQADIWLEEDIAKLRKEIKTLGNFTEHQEDSLISFAYNLGFDRLTHSTLLKVILRIESYEEIIRQFLRWKYADVGGVLTELKGLTLRRKCEGVLFLFDRLDFEDENYDKEIEYKKINEGGVRLIIKEELDRLDLTKLNVKTPKNVINYTPPPIKPEKVDPGIEPYFDSSLTFWEQLNLFLVNIWKKAVYQSMDMESKPVYSGTKIGLILTVIGAIVALLTKIFG